MDNTPTAGTPPDPIKLFVSRLAIKPFCSDDVKRFGQKQRFKHIALKRAQIQPGRPFDRQCIVVDIDASDAGAVWMDRDVPQPNIVVRNPANGHAHYIYLLDAPVLIAGEGKAGRKGPWDFYRAITEKLTHALGGDPGYNQVLVKNPLHQQWQTHIVRHEPYSLAELDEYLPEKVRKVRAAIGEGRNTTLFDELRLWAYRNVARYRREDNVVQWSLAVEREAGALNTFEPPLPTREAQSVARSVATFAWENAANFSVSELGGVKRRKVRREDREEMSLEEAQQRILLGRQLGQVNQVKKTREKIAKAVREINAGERRPTQEEVARRADVSVRTVRNHKDLLVPAGTVTALTQVYLDPTVDCRSPESDVHLPVAEQIAVAAQVLRESGVPVTHAAVATLVGISVKTVQRHRQMLLPRVYDDLLPVETRILATA